MNKVVILLLLFISPSLYSQKTLTYDTDDNYIDKIFFVDSTHFVIADNGYIKKYMYKESKPVAIDGITKNKIVSVDYKEDSKTFFIADDDNKIYSYNGSVKEQIFQNDKNIGDIALFEKGNKLLILNKENSISILNIKNSETQTIKLKSKPISECIVNDSIIMVGDIKGNFYIINTFSSKISSTLNISKYGLVSMNLNPSNNLIDIYSIDGKIQSYDVNSGVIYCSFSLRQNLVFGRTFSNNLLVYSNEFGKTTIATVYREYHYDVKSRINDFKLIPELSKRRELSFVVATKYRGIIFVRKDALN